MTSNSSNSDQDQKLSESIEKANTKGVSISEDIDPIAADLITYKTSKKRLFLNQTSNKEAVWNKIEEATNQKSSSNILSFISSSTRKWAAAAVIIIGAALSILYVQNFQGPTLVAQSTNSIQVVSLDDGSSVTLRPNSTLYSLASSSTSTTYELEGEAFFDVTADPTRTFSVKTTNGMISVLGTRFNLSSWGKRLQIYLEEGSVKVESNTNDSSLVLQPGESALIGDNNLPVRQTLNADETKDWLNGQLVFDDKEVGLITAELEQQFNVLIDISESVESQKLSGQLSLDNIEAALTDLGLVLDGYFEKRADSYTFTKN